MAPEDPIMYHDPKGNLPIINQAIFSRQGIVPTNKAYYEKKVKE